MRREQTPADARRIVATLNRHGVDYIVIGGEAARMRGAHRPTFDVDVVAATGPDNLARLAAALQELGARIRGAEHLDDVLHRAQLHPAALRQRQFGNWSTDAGDVDTALFVGTPAEPISFTDLAINATRTNFDGVVVVVASLDDLIRAKELADRPKDHEALPELRLLRDAEHARTTAQQGQPPPTLGTQPASPTRGPSPSGPSSQTPNGPEAGL